MIRLFRCRARRATPEERARFLELARRFEEIAKTDDDVGFMRVDLEFNELSVTAARNEFAAGAMSLMHPLSRRFDPARRGSARRGLRILLPGNRSGTGVLHCGRR